MSRTAKIILIVAGGVLIFCLCTGVAGWMGLRMLGSSFQRAIKTDPTEAAAAAGRIAAFDLPAGYKLTSFSLLGFDTVMLNPQGSSVHRMTIMLMQFPYDADLSQENMEEQMKRMVEQQGGTGGISYELVEVKTISIRGEEVPSTLSEGTTQSGLRFRQMIAYFTGNGGIASLMITGPASGWDQRLIDQFIQSIR